MITYLVILALLGVLEVCYFKVADRFNIIDKPNERSSHTRIVLRGGGIIFTIALWIWSIWTGFPYPWMLAGVTLAAGISFVDDIHSLPDSLRLVTQFASMFLVFQEVGLLFGGTSSAFGIGDWLIWGLIVLAALIVAVAGTNIFNFMDGINGITGGYALAMLIPLYLKNEVLIAKCGEGFVDGRKCFAGDVGSIGMALILVFCLGRLMYVTGGYHLDCAVSVVWTGWYADYLPSHHVA